MQFHPGVGGGHFRPFLFVVACELCEACMCVICGGFFGNLKWSRGANIQGFVNAWGLD